MKIWGFSKRRRTWFVLSLIMITVGLLSLAARGLNLGIDFVGGTRLELEFRESVTEGQIREVLAGYELGDAEIQLLGAERSTVSIRTMALPAGDERRRLFDELETLAGPFVIASLDEVMPIIGREIQQEGLVAVALASLAMVAYITYRFQLRFAVVALATALHDVVLTLGVFSLLWLEIDSAFVAAMLTIVGYSINDTIIIFDRIRENLKHRQRETLAQLVDMSISQTLSRSINTSATTLLAVSALLIFGSTTIRDFSLALMIGIAVGTYSSIFVASPLWLTWQELAAAGSRSDS